jgi:transcriptional regulator with XRE-family HTH domain
MRALACDGASASYIARLENDERRPTRDVLSLLAPRLGVSICWLETGERDPAEQLAELVLASEGQALPPRAATLARRVLRRGAL